MFAFKVTILTFLLFDIVFFLLMVIKLFLIFEKFSAKADKKGLFGSRWFSFVFVHRSIHLHSIVELFKRRKIQWKPDLTKYLDFRKIGATTNF